MISVTIVRSVASPYIEDATLTDSMTLLFIYGPPAAGKTTVGRKVAKLTNYRFFFNHLTVPAAKAIFPDSTSLHHDERYTQLLHRLRLDGLAAAADAGYDTIFTLAYSGMIDNDFVAAIADLFESRGGRVCFVELHASTEILVQRVGDSSRTALGLGKMTSPERLRQTLAARDLFASVPYPDILKINTDECLAADAAERIVNAFTLRPAINR